MRTTYVFDKKLGKLVPIKRGQLPLRSEFGTFVTGCKDERDPDNAVPRALRSMPTTEENKFIRESGFSASHVRRVWEL